MTKSIFAIVCTIVFGAALSACNDGTADGSAPYDLPNGPISIIPDIPTEGGTGTPTKPALGESCHGTVDYCLAVKYVVYNNSAGNPIVSAAQTVANIKTINSLWKQCGIGFQVDTYVEADAADYGLNFSPSVQSELTRVRNTFVDDTTLLLATVGEWSFAANAWTAMPGGEPYGAVMEQSVGTYAPIIAHEIGHYLNLDHAASADYLMYYMIYSTSTKLSASECSRARSAIEYFWSKMLR